MAWAYWILPLLVFPSYISSTRSSVLGIDIKRKSEAERTGRQHRQLTQTACNNEDEFKATYPCTHKEFMEPTKKTCVWYSQSQKNWYHANFTCREMGSKLVKITDNELNAALVEKGASKKWWIGAFELRGDELRWSGDSAAPSFFNWQPGTDPGLNQTSPFACVVLNADQHGFWTTEPCFDQRFFICQRDSARSHIHAVLKISGDQDDAERGTTVAMGYDLKATCEVYGHVVDNVVFMLDNQAAHFVQTYDRSKEAVHFSPEPRYERRSDFCWQVTTVTLTLPVTMAMDNGMLYCRAILHDGLIAESPKRRINVRVQPRRPTLIVDFDEEPDTIYAGRDKIVATCVAPISGSDNSLTWAIRNKKETWKWSRKLPSRHAWLFVSWLEAPSPRGRVMNSTLVIYSEFGFSALVIACLSYSKPANNFRRGVLFSKPMLNPLRDIVGPIFLKTFNPMPPRLTKLFVSQQGEAGVKIKVQCIAFVGDIKTLTWSLHFGDGNVRKVMVDGSGKVSGGKLPEGVVMSEKKVWQLKEGSEILSTLSIESPKNVDNTTLVCFSHNNTGEKVDRLRRSVILRSKEVPPMTELSVSYHKPPSTVYGNRTMKATCTASLGKNGNLTWALRTRRGEALWTVSADGKLYSGGAATGVDVSARKVGPGTQKDQSMFTSSLSLEVNESIHDGNVTCRTRSGEGPIEVWNVSRNLVVRYLARPPILVVRDVSPPVTWIKQANCSAYVGSHGVITWLMLFVNGSLSWQFNTMGILSGVIPDAVNESEYVVSFHPRHGPRISSSLKIDVSEFPEQTNLVCSSDNSSNLAPMNELVVWEYLNPLPRRGASDLDVGGLGGMEWTLTIFILFHLVLLVILYFLPKKQRRRNLKERPRSRAPLGDVNPREDTPRLSYDEADIDWDASGPELSYSQAEGSPYTPKSHPSNEHSFWSWSGYSTSVDGNT